MSVHNSLQTLLRLLRLGYMKIFFYTILAGVLALPVSAFAQVVPETTGGANSGVLDASSLTGLLNSFVGLVNTVFVPFIFAISFIVFIWGIFKYFILGGASDDERKKGKQLMVWGIVAFFVMVSLWGIVNLLRGSFGGGFNEATPPLPSFNVER